VTPRKLYNFYIDPDLADGLKRLKALDRDSEGAIVRRALRQYLEARGVMKAERKRASTRKRSQVVGGVPAVATAARCPYCADSGQKLGIERVQASKRCYRFTL
jgi:Ribbon-helix-helix protein, copG family